MENLYEIHFGTGMYDPNPHPLHKPIEIFASQMLPYFNKAFDEHEPKEFFNVAFPLFDDRFPTATPRQKKFWSMCLILLDGALHSGMFSLPPYMGNWRDEITLEADRRRRRVEWEKRGLGVAPIEHQYIVAFEDDTAAATPHTQT
ncbi:hypothetical protein PLEOSDRAFT_1108747 [Pleurotus ostreatus PC15]|nr:hypothetical protein PLEOSDRAFT_1108747 [Pleurotus ostreatus PC15]